MRQNVYARNLVGSENGRHSGAMSDYVHYGNPLKELDLGRLMNSNKNKLRYLKCRKIYFVDSTPREKTDCCFRNDVIPFFDVSVSKVRICGDLGFRQTEIPFLNRIRAQLIEA